MVTIFNRHTNRSVYLGSISGSVSDFYSSYFEENLVPPLGNTTFNVVFLPRQQATIQAHLVIHTSFGVLNYEVKGKGVECPYRLSPLVGLKAPLNATLIPEIFMYNPFDTPLQIVEVYSSGGQFQLELPNADDRKPADGSETATSDYERSETLWEIPPYSTRPVIRVRFTATAAGNQTAYIRIKVSAKRNAALEKAVIVLPIEVEIFKENGIYSSTPLLDLGMGGTNDRPKSFTVRLKNSGHDRIHIDACTVEADANIKNAISLEMDTAHASPTDSTYHIIRGTVDWSRVTVERFFRGHIVVHTRRKRADGTIHRAPYRIPFSGTILHGAIQYNESLTRFHLSEADDMPQQNGSPRDFRIRNNFDRPLAITNLTTDPDTQTYFRIDQFKPRILQPGQVATIFQLLQQPLAMAASVTRSILLHTNVSHYEIDIFSFNGLLRRILPVDEQLGYDTININRRDIDERSIDFGILPLSTPSYITLALVNPNPIPINIHNWKGTVSSAAHVGITVPGCSKLTMKGLKFCNIVKPGEWILFQIGVESNTVGTFDGKFTVQTDYEVIDTPIRFSTDMGVLKFTTKMTESDKCFPVSGLLRTLLFVCFLTHLLGIACCGISAFLSAFYSHALIS